MLESVFQELMTRWKSPIVARTEAEAFTGGAMTAKYLANLDALGKGPEGRFLLGRKVVYPTVNFVSWLQGRAKRVEP